MHAFILDLLIFFVESFQRAGRVLCAENEAIQRTRRKNYQWSIRLQRVRSNTIWNIAHCNCTHVHTYYICILNTMACTYQYCDILLCHKFVTDDNYDNVIIILCHQQFSHKKCVQPGQWKCLLFVGWFFRNW